MTVQIKITPSNYSLDNKQLENFASEYLGILTEEATAELAVFTFPSEDDGKIFQETLDSTFKNPPSPPGKKTRKTK